MTDPRIDAYIAKSAEFARPILTYVRKAIHKACPDVEETMKWGFPHYDYKGVMCSSAAFKEHCAFTFWRGSLIKDPKGLMQKEDRQAMGHFGRIGSLEDLPGEKDFIALVKQAMLLNEAGVKTPRSKVVRDPNRKVTVPPALLKNLKQDKNAWLAWEKFSYSHKKEYVEYFVEAKTAETREKRLQKMLVQIADAKSLNWKYAKK